MAPSLFHLALDTRTLSDSVSLGGITTLDTPHSDRLHPPCVLRVIYALLYIEMPLYIQKIESIPPFWCPPILFLGIHLIVGPLA